jgi:hypothetical protein
MIIRIENECLLQYYTILWLRLFHCIFKKVISITFINILDIYFCCLQWNWKPTSCMIINSIHYLMCLFMFLQCWVSKTSLNFTFSKNCSPSCHCFVHLRFSWKKFKHYIKCVKQHKTKYFLLEPIELILRLKKQQKKLYQLTNNFAYNWGFFTKSFAIEDLNVALNLAYL